MKKFVLLFTMFLLCVGCSNTDSSSGGSNYTELEVADSNTISSKRITGTIGEQGEVDLYRVHLTQTNRNVQIKCTQKLDDDEDISGDQQNLTLLLQIYEEDANGNLTMVAGEQAEDGSPLPADLKQTVYVDRVKDLFVHVRDLMDNNNSQRPYYISAIYETPPDGNDSLGSTDTVTLTIDGNGAADEIGSVGDVDFFKFDITTAGVYDISVAYDEFLSAGMELSMTLTSQPDGTELDERSIENDGTVHMIHYLEAGSYAVALDDEGRDDFSPTSTYTINVETTSITEVMENDTPSSVSGVAMPATTNGSLAYYEDQDWYPVDQAVGSDLSVLEMTFTPGDSMTYQVSVYELADPAAFNSSEDTPLFVRNVLRSIHGALQATIKLDRTMAYFVLVTAASGSDIDEGKPYTLALETVNVDDDADEVENDNNTSQYPTEPSQGVAENGKIAYRGDVDWYRFQVPNVSDQVLDVYLDIPGTLETPPNAQYGFEIYDTELNTPLKRVVPALLSQRVSQMDLLPSMAVDLKTGIRVEAGATYYVKVFDVQNNDSDDAFYTLTWDVAVAGTPGNDPDGGTADYYSETDEDVLAAENQITILGPLETADDIKAFNVNTTALSVDTMAHTSPGGYEQYTSNWMSGYVDYQGDEDWFGLDLTNPSPDVTLAEGESWYYTIDLELYSDQSPVEFVLEFLPDSNGDQEMNSRLCESYPSNRWTTCNGTQAAIADGTPGVFESSQLLSLISENKLNSTDSCIWMGSGGPDPWDGMVYFRVRDFNYIYLDEARNNLNENPDDDWSVTVPYYFRITLKFYTGSFHPPISD